MRQALRGARGVMVYVVIPTAVYDHGIIGVFSTEAKAREAAEAFWAGSDGHHGLRIEEWPLDRVDFGHSDGAPDRWVHRIASPALRAPRVVFEPWERKYDIPEEGAAMTHDAQTTTSEEGAN